MSGNKSDIKSDGKGMLVTATLFAFSVFILTITIYLFLARNGQPVVGPERNDHHVMWVLLVLFLGLSAVSVWWQRHRIGQIKIRNAPDADKSD